MFNGHLDRRLLGAKAIGEVAEIFDKDGNVDIAAVYHALANGYLDANKFGWKWTSTPRRIRASFMGGAK